MTCLPRDYLIISTKINLKLKLYKVPKETGKQKGYLLPV